MPKTKGSVKYRPPVESRMLPSSTSRVSTPLSSPRSSRRRRSSSVGSPAYATAPTIEKIIASPEFGIALLKNLQQEQNMRREAELRVRRLQPLADYTALILACPETVSVSQVAQDYGMSAVAFNRILNRAGIQYSVGGQWVLYAAYKDRGLVQSYTFNYRHNDGTDGCKMYTRWTQRGRLFLYDILKKIGIIPMIEKTTDNDD